MGVHTTYTAVCVATIARAALIVAGRHLSREYGATDQPDISAVSGVWDSEHMGRTHGALGGGEEAERE